MHQQLDPAIYAGIRAAVEDRLVGRGYPAAQDNQRAAARYKVVMLAAAAALGLTDDAIANLGAADIEQIGARIVADSWHFGGDGDRYDADYVDALGRAKHRAEIADEQEAIDSATVFEYRCPSCNHDVDEPKLQHQPCTECSNDSTSERRRTYTTIVAGPERHDGEEPYIYRGHARSHREAVLDACVAYVVQEESNDIEIVSVKEGATSLVGIHDLRLTPVVGTRKDRGAAFLAFGNWMDTPDPATTATARSAESDE